MSLRDQLADLLAPARAGDEIGPGVRFLGASDELGMRLSFDAHGTRVHVELATPEEDRPHAAASTLLRFSYRAGSSDAPVPPDVGVAVCEAVARACEPNESNVLDGIAQAAAAGQESVHPTAKVREVHAQRLLERGGTDTEPFFTLSPYVGCVIGCRFCYAQTPVGRVRRLSRLPEVRWGSYVDVRINAPALLARELPALPPLPIKFCPIVSDPYQAVELRYELTRRCLKVLADAAPRPVLILTRSALIQRDAAVIARLPRAWAGVSIGTADDAVRTHFEPRAASVADRLASLDVLRAAGIQTFAVVQPILPGSVEDLADALAARVVSVSIDVLRGVQGAETEFAHPVYGVAREPEWQRDRARQLTRALEDRGVAVWDAELPPGWALPADGGKRPETDGV